MKITVNKQSSIKIVGSKTIYVDPIDYGPMHDADYIFITHPHWDHFSLVSILELRHENTVFLTPKDLVEELLNVGISEEYIYVVKPNEQLSLKSMDLKTIPAYNIKTKHHLKSQNWVGYLINIDNKSIYIMGDTDMIKEALDVKCDILFIPIGGTYTMDYKEAAKLTNIIKPHKVIPTHYGFCIGSINDAINFKSLINKEIKCEILIGSDKHNEFDN